MYRVKADFLFHCCYELAVVVGGEGQGRRGVGWVGWSGGRVGGGGCFFLLYIECKYKENKVTSKVYFEYSQFLRLSYKNNKSSLKKKKQQQSYINESIYTLAIKFRLFERLCKFLFHIEKLRRRKKKKKNSL